MGRPTSNECTVKLQMSLVEYTPFTWDLSSCDVQVRADLLYARNKKSAAKLQWEEDRSKCGCEFRLEILFVYLYVR